MGGMDGRSPQLRTRTQASEDGYRAGFERNPDTTVSVRIKELTQLPGDQIFKAGALPIEILLVPDAQYPYTLLRNMRGFRCIDVVGAVYVDISGQGARKVLDKDTFDFIKVNSVRFIIPAAGSVTFQQWGE